MRRIKVERIKYKRYQLKKYRRFLTESKELNKHPRRRKKIDSMALTSNIIKFLNQQNFGHKTEISSSMEIEIPEVFSFIENPDETIKILKYLFFLGTSNKVTSLHFNHNNCKILGICASTVMDVILIELKRTNKIFKNKLALSGIMPRKGIINDILEVSGIIKHLGFATRERSYIKKLDLIKGNRNFRLSLSDEVATKVTDYFLDCLSTQKYTLNKDGKQKMSEMIGEIIENCELHGGELSEWFTIGHYHIIDGEKYGQCHLVFFNYGDTIYQSLKKSVSEEINNSLDQLTKKHRSFFKAFVWTEESLWTLYALQDGVSRLRDRVKDPDRGTGTVKLIDNFQSIGKTKDGLLPLMSITSGNTHIIFNEKYRLQSKNFGKETRQIIAFNTENDLNIPPDKNNVKILKNFFPGTVISMRFYLDHSYINEVVNSGNKPRPI